MTVAEALRYTEQHDLTQQPKLLQQVLLVLIARTEDLQEEVNRLESMIYETRQRIN